MQNISALTKAPHPVYPVNRIAKFLSHFKYEIIKILIFLLLFFASIFYVNNESKVYYGDKTRVSEKF